MMMLNKYIYAARDKSTGKLVSNITSPSKKYWQHKGSAITAINKANERRLRCGVTYRGELELVTFELVEVKCDAKGFN